MRNRHFRAAIALILAAPLGAHAACVEPLPGTADASPGAWQDVTHRSASLRDNPHITHQQYLDRDGVGDVLLEYYAVTLDAGEQTPQQLLQQFRSGIPGYLQDTAYEVEPIDQASAQRWDASSPVGALLVFTLPDYVTVKDKRGAVVASCADTQTFRLNYVGVAGNRHPVVGARAFGVVSRAGALTLFMKAATRRNSFDPHYRQLDARHVLNKESQLWQSLLVAFQADEAHRHPRAVVSFQQTLTGAGLLAAGIPLAAGRP